MKAPAKPNEGETILNVRTSTWSSHAVGQYSQPHESNSAQPGLPPPDAVTLEQRVKFLPDRLVAPSTSP